MNDNVSMQDDKTNDGDIIHILLKLMENYENDKELIGSQKKELVKSELRTVIGVVAYDRYYYIIELLIEFIIGLSKKDIEIGLNKIKKNCFCR
jgi:hypothetical protein